MDLLGIEKVDLDPTFIKEHFACSFLKDAVARDKMIKRNYARVRGLNPLTDEYSRALTHFYEKLEEGASLYREHLQKTLSEWSTFQTGCMITHDEREHAFNLFRGIWEKYWIPIFEG